MIHLYGREAQKHIEQFKIKKLPFELIVHTIIKIKDKRPDDIRSAYMGAEFIAKDNTSGDYYWATWGSGGGSYTETYSFYKINFDLYSSYLKADISYHRFKFESLKRNGIMYRMNLYNRQFCEKDCIVLKVGNVIEYSEGYAIDFTNMCSYYMIVPYEYKEEYEPLGFKCEETPWYDSCMYKVGQKREHDKNPELKVFVKMMNRAMKVSELLD